MNTGNIVPLCFAAPLFVCLIIREIRWRDRLENWIKSEGAIVGFSHDPDYGPYPIIGYMYNGEYCEKTVEFNLYAEPVGKYEPSGKKIPIIFNPTSGEVFIVSFRHRWTLSLLLLGCILFLLFVSYVSK